MTPEPLSRTDDLLKHGEALRRLARRLVGNACLADDVVQQAYVVALENPPRSHHGLAGWLRRVVATRAIDERRRVERRRAREEVVSREEHVPSHDETLAVQRDVLDAIRALPDPYRTVVFLRFYEGLTSREIAARLQVPQATVKTRIARALERLRHRLDDHHPNGRAGWVHALSPLLWHSATHVGRSAQLLAVTMNLKNTLWITLALLLLFIGYRTWMPHDDVEDTRQAGLTTEGSERSDEGESAPRGMERREDESRKTEVTPDPILDELHDTVASLRVRTTWVDGQPARDVALFLDVHADARRERNTLRALTDGEGLATFPEVVAGSVTLSSERGGTSKLEIAPGETQEVVFQIPAGTDVLGIVVDAQDHPVADAEVWLTTGRGDWLGGRVVARSDVEGRFALRHVDRKQSLGALAPGYLRSKLVDLEVIEGVLGPDKVRLMLVRGGGRLTGSVVTRAGQPVVDALVALGGAASPYVDQLARTSTERWTPRVQRTDASGAFAFEGVRSGDHPLTVRALGHPLWADVVSVGTGDSTHRTITLKGAVSIHGTVRDESGAVVSGARVRVLESDELDEMEWGEDEYPFGRVETTTDAAGTYSLASVPEGAVMIQAQAGQSWNGKDYRGRAREQRTLQAGDDVTWDLTIGLGRVIRGRVQTVSGKSPRVFGMIMAMPERAGARNRPGVYTQDGEFLFPHCEDAPHTLRLEAPGLVGGALEKKGVWPDGDLVLIEVPDALPREAVVFGRVEDAGGCLASPDELGVEVECDEGWFREAKCRGLTFEAAEMAAGRYRVLVKSPRGVVAHGEWFDLANSERHDAGTFVTQAPGSVVVHPRWTNGARPTALEGWIGTRPMRRRLAWDGERLHASDVPPGTQEVAITGDGVHAFAASVLIREGQEASLEVALTPGIVVPYEVQKPSGTTGWEVIAIRVTDAAGTVFVDRTLRDQIGLGWPVKTRMRLPRGAFTIVATTDAGQRFETTVEVNDLEVPPPAPVVRWP